MLRIPTDSRMDFDHSISTEHRFALRNWLDDFILAVNNNDEPLYAQMLVPNFVASGFIDTKMDHALFLTFLATPLVKKKVRIMRLPELQIKFQKNVYKVSGTFEQFIDGIMSDEGTIEIRIAPVEESFLMEEIEFFPRLKTTSTDNDDIANG